MTLLDKVTAAAKYLQAQGFNDASTGIILGTGLGGLIKEVETITSVDYADIPYFPISTVESHSGKLILGQIAQHKVIIMQGRFHYYEGYDMSEVVMPVRVMHQLGIKQLLVSNAAGNMNMSWNKGDLVLLDDHINLQPDNPLRGKEAQAFGSIFTDMSAPYDSKLNALALASAEKLEITLHEGVYVAVAGPNLETRAEYRFLRNAGADVVGMSTVPEIIAANQLNLSVMAISVLTDTCDPDNLAPIDIDEIIATAAKAEKKLVALFKEIINSL